MFITNNMPRNIFIYSLYFTLFWSAPCRLKASFLVMGVFELFEAVACGVKFRLSASDNKNKKQQQQGHYLS